ncbi:MAG: dephospho-CoA kinase [Proteobacteria bacterium]|nr:dephospho-CoA kinase [Pseudomonadota bacterium]
MLIIGLTGSIAMGKTVAAGYFRRLGVPVHDADAAVHRLLAPGGGGVAAVGAAFPGVVIDGAVDRKALGKQVFGNAAALKRLERILHPLVRRSETAFLGRACRERRRVVILDVPLLFETGGEARCDVVCVVSAPPELQRRRALARPGMTEDRLAAVLARQMPDREKRRRADFVIRSGRGRAQALQDVRRILKVLQPWAGTHWPPRRIRRSAR